MASTGSGPSNGERRATGLRADAERNRVLIVQTARHIFETEGTGVSLAEIARRAGVGYATAYRRFPTRQALVEEVLWGNFTEIMTLAETAAQDGDDPWETFAGLIRGCCEHQVAEPGLAGALAQHFDQLLAQLTDPDAGERLRAAFDQLAARAKAAGALRPDITLEDVLLIPKANAGVIANSPGTEAESSRRFVELALDSLHTRRDQNQ